MKGHIKSVAGLFGDIGREEDFHGYWGLEVLHGFQNSTKLKNSGG
jgi:hypothetical protein